MLHLQRAKLRAVVLHRKAARSLDDNYDRVVGVLL
jgi:hypothetical protein